jgi:hypothetical protein
MHQPRILVVWGKNDTIFLPPGAEAYNRDVPRARFISMTRDTLHSKRNRLTSQRRSRRFIADEGQST